MHKGSHKRNSLMDRITAFILMVTVSVGTEKGRNAVSRLAAVSKQMNRVVKVGFKITLFIIVLSLLFFVKKWMFG